jgi:hypothetical protein
MLFIVGAMIFVIVLAGVIVAQRFQISKLQGSLWAEERNTKSANALRSAASKRVAELEARCQTIAIQLDNSIRHTGEALNRAGLIEYVSQQLHALTEFAGLTVDAAPARHAIPAEYPPAPPPPNLAQPQYMPPHAHVQHEAVPARPDGEALPAYQDAEPYDQYADEPPDYGTSVSFAGGPIQYIHDRED